MSDSLSNPPASNQLAYFLAQCSNYVYESAESLCAWFATLPDWRLEPADLIEHAETSTLSFVACNPISNELVVCFKGSHELTDWLRNLTDSELVPWAHAAAECRVNASFVSSWSSVREPMIMRIQAMLDQLDPARGMAIHLTGHSLGGALATLAAADLVEALAIRSMDSRALGVYTFGAPVVGDQRFVDLYNEHVHSHLWADFHYVTPDDPIDAWLNSALSGLLGRLATDGAYARMSNRIVLPASDYLNGHSMDNYIQLLGLPPSADEGAA